MSAFDALCGLCFALVLTVAFIYVGKEFSTAGDETMPWYDNGEAR